MTQVMKITISITIARYRLEGSSGVRPYAIKQRIAPTQSMIANPLVNSLKSFTHIDVFYFSVSLFSPLIVSNSKANSSPRPFEKSVLYLFFSSSKDIL